MAVSCAPASSASTWSSSPLRGGSTTSTSASWHWPCATASSADRHSKNTFSRHDCGANQTQCMSLHEMLHGSGYMCHITEQRLLHCKSTQKETHIPLEVNRHSCRRLHPRRDCCRCRAPLAPGPLRSGRARPRRRTVRRQRSPGGHSSPPGVLSQIRKGPDLTSEKHTMLIRHNKCCK